MPLFTKYRKFTVAIEWLLSGYCVAIEWLLSGYWSCPLKHSLNVGISKRKSYCLYQNYCTTWCQAESYFTMAAPIRPLRHPKLNIEKVSTQKPWYPARIIASPNLPQLRRTLCPLISFQY